jgi:hypothetical protein
MLNRETVAVYCENHTEHTNPIATTYETHYVFTIEISRLMLFKETVAVYYENHTEHTNPVRTSQETHYVSSTERLTLFGETVAVHCENHKEHMLQTVQAESSLFHRKSVSISHYVELNDRMTGE